MLAAASELQAKASVEEGKSPHELHGVGYRDVMLKFHKGEVLLIAFFVLCNVDMLKRASL